MSPRVSAPVEEDYPSVPVLRAPRYSQSVERGLAVLECFGAGRAVLGIADIADELGMSRSTTHRYVVTLVALDFMEQVADRKYRLGLRVTDLGMSALNSMGLREHAHPYLDELRKRTMFTTSLAVLDGAEVLYVDRVRSLRRGQHKIGLDVRLGSRLPAYCTALGKVLLAGVPEPQRRGIVCETRLQKRGPNTIAGKKALLVELEHVGEEGVAVNDEEFAAGLVAVAAPVRDEGRDVVAAVNLAAHTDTIALEGLIGALGPHLLATADQISARLGYRRGDQAR